jgi:hypothetical protein
MWPPTLPTAAACGWVDRHQQTEHKQPETMPRTRKSALLESAAHLIETVLLELREDGEDGETALLAEMVEDLSAMALTYEYVESAAH